MNTIFRKLAHKILKMAYLKCSDCNTINNRLTCKLVHIPSFFIQNL